MVISTLGSGCSIRVLRTNIWSTQDLPLSKPVCFSLRILSTFVLILCKRTQNTFPGTDKGFIPRQLPHCDKSPFLGSLIMISFCQSLGTSSFVQTMLKSPTRHLGLVAGYALSMSEVIPSSLLPLLPFVSRITFSISAHVMGPFFISSSLAPP